MSFYFVFKLTSLFRRIFGINQLPSWQTIHTIVFDFDGIFTNNLVYIDQYGNESVCCSRADGLAFDLLRDFAQTNYWDLDYFILSTEANPVVSARSKKLNIRHFSGVRNKRLFLEKYLKTKKAYDGDGRNLYNGLVYLGNDLNDLPIILQDCFSVVPKDAHPAVKKSASLVLNVKGGEGFVRHFIEKLIGI